MLWNGVILIWLGACGAVLGLIPSDDLPPFSTVRKVIAALVAVVIIEEAFRSPGGLKEKIIKIALGGVFWLSYWGLVRATGGWQGGADGALIGAMFGIVLGVALILVCWLLAGAEGPGTTATSGGSNTDGKKGQVGTG
jgi:hypothetical protein